MSTGSIQSFTPVATLTVAGSTTSTAVTLTIGGDSLLIFNSASAIAFFRLDAGPATITDTPIPPGARIVVDAPSTVQFASVVLLAGSGSVFLMRGNGNQY